MFDFGGNLRALRCKKGLTQEQAAELLNVSKQSVSRWENGITCPDISFLPHLASFYGVTVDAMLGADEPVRQQELASYAAQHQAAHHRGDTEGAYELSRALCERFPNERQAMSDRMIDAYLLGKGAAGTKRRSCLQEALAAAERFEKMTEDAEELNRCRRISALCCKLLGQPEKAREWLDKLPSVWSGIELCALEVLEEQELSDHIASALRDMTDVMLKLLFASAEEPVRSAAERAAILEKIPRLLELLFVDGDLGLFAPYLARVFARLGESGDGETRREYGKKALDTAAAFDRQGDGVHTSLLFRGLRWSPEEFTTTRAFPAEADGGSAGKT